MENYKDNKLKKECNTCIYHTPFKVLVGMGKCSNENCWDETISKDWCKYHSEKNEI